MQRVCPWRALALPCARFAHSWCLSCPVSHTTAVFVCGGAVVACGGRGCPAVRLSGCCAARAHRGARRRGRNLTTDVQITFDSRPAFVEDGGRAELFLLDTMAPHVYTDLDHGFRADGVGVVASNWRAACGVRRAARERRAAWPRWQQVWPLSDAPARPRLRLAPWCWRQFVARQFTAMHNTLMGWARPGCGGCGGCGARPLCPQAGGAIDTEAMTELSNATALLLHASICVETSFEGTAPSATCSGAGAGGATLTPLRGGRYALAWSVYIDAHLRYSYPRTGGPGQADFTLEAPELYFRGAKDGGSVGSAPGAIDAPGAPHLACE